MSSSEALALRLAAWGTAQADSAQAATLRKQLPAWAPAGMPGHFLKHADEQTLVAIAAVDRAICDHRVDPAGLSRWSVVAAPRFMGRMAGVAALDRYARGGGPALSPHLIPQHSLHSVSGALSILLASRQPNLGVGGGVDSLSEGLLAALSLPRTSECAGVWLVATAWNPEPVIDRQGGTVNGSVCYAAALALEPASSARSLGHLQLHRDALHAARDSGGGETQPIGVPQLCNCLDSLSGGSGRGEFRWPVPGGASLVLQIDATLGELSAAA
jgi:hypothetical protein